MPTYNNWGAFAQQSRLPPTPPEFQTAYLTPMSAVSEQCFYPSQGFPTRRASTREYNERYHHGPAYAAQHSMSVHANHRLSHLAQEYSLPGYPAQAVSQYQFNAIAAPILPPIRVTEPIDHFAGQYIHAQTEVKQKEEKPTGGVAQHLDYEMDLMAGFVAEMSQKIVAPGNTPSAQYRKYVAQILSSTRLPSSTIMLGLFYLSSRMKIISERSHSASSSGAVYRMLTTCLLLGSKFLDDNTFQNRSWAEVSAIPVQELNMMELEWLVDFNWEIHGMMYDGEEGFFMWIGHWHAYEREQKAQMAKVKEMQKLAPIETNLRRSHSVHHQPLMSPEGPIPPQYQQSSQYDTQWARPFISEYSPPSAPHSGPATPEYYQDAWSHNQTPSYTRQSWNAGSTPAYAAQRTHLPSYHQNTSFHLHGYAPSTWTGHGSNCGCTLCAKHSEYYFAHQGYGMQTVVG